MFVQVGSPFLDDPSCLCPVPLDNLYQSTDPDHL